MTLHGPADPDAFRVKVGRYYDRHYFDPLPADKGWSATQDVWPAVSTIKRADGKDWSNVSLERAAKYIAERPGELAGLDADAIKERLIEVNKSGLRGAGNRGTQIHATAESIAAGTHLPDLDAAARPYLPALHAFIDDHTPEFLLTEGVVINRTLGYGGTFDAVLKIAGKNYLVDWKTRSKEHGAYPEEGAQLAAYANCEYVIVEDDGRAYRQPLPTLDGYLIISLHPSGYRLYPVNEAKAWTHFRGLLEWWTLKRDAHDIVEKPVLLSKPVGAKKTRAKKSAIVEAALHSEAVASVALDGETQSVGLDEGPDYPDMAAALLTQLKALPDLHRAVAYRWAKEAANAGLNIKISEQPTQRRCEIARAMIAWAPKGDDALRSQGPFDDVPTGVVLAGLTIEAAKKLADEAMR